MISRINFRSEGADNYPKKFVDPKKAAAYEDIHWVRIHEDGNIENIDIGGQEMKKIIKVIVRILISIAIIILMPIIILEIQVNYVKMQIDTTNGPMQKLVKNEVT
ncbi:hypothetical protein CLPUN_44740 [Clostridium puniceum]|uniref:Uncharacterized protein n=1 Tax=Clostridium puniceum TaxID=29367 RepID=A0A1S8T7A5_9CLOT|nr:hypothetical protein [Clostridium puniceum]OOM73578.1 hypothetical protein CLPUN_44740 [Clostridium puniceum]